MNLIHTLILRKNLENFLQDFENLARFSIFSIFLKDFGNKYFGFFTFKFLVFLAFFIIFSKKDNFSPKLPEIKGKTIFLDVFRVKGVCLNFSKKLLFCHLFLSILVKHFFLYKFSVTTPSGGRKSKFIKENGQNLIFNDF